MFVQNGELMKRLKIPGRAWIERRARPNNIYDEGEELYDDIVRRYRNNSDGTVVFSGSQWEWEEGVVNNLLASRGQRIDWKREY